MVSKKTSKSLKSNKKSIIILAVSVFLGLVLIFGCVFGIIAATRKSGYVAYYKNVGVDKGVSNYLISYYKSFYLQSLSASGVEAYDTEEFWNSNATTGKTYGEHFSSDSENYISQIIAANVIFDAYTTLSQVEKYEIESAVDEILQYRAGGDKRKFNENCAMYGFDFADFEKATELLYKAWAVSTKVMGSQNENVTSFKDECLQYFLTAYSNVHLIFIRTESTFVLDEKGNRVKDDDGNDKLRPLEDAEIVERYDRIAEVRDVAKGINSGDVVEERFNHYQNIYDEGDLGSHLYGYYFNRDSEYTKEFAEAFDSVVETALVMSVGQVEEVETSIGVCFIHKTNPDREVMNNYSSVRGLIDFRDLAADEIFQGLVNELVKEVAFTKKWEDITPTLVPYNTDYIARY